MRNPDDHKTTATNADLLLIMRNLKTKNNCNKSIFTFNYAKAKDQKTAAKNKDFL